MSNKAKTKQSSLRNKTLSLALGVSLIGSMLSAPLSVANAAEEKLNIAVQTDGVQIDGSFVESTITLTEDGVKDSASVKLDKGNNFKHTYPDRNEHAKFELDSVLNEEDAEKYESIVTGDKNSGFTVFNLDKEFLEGTVTVMYVDEKGNEIAQRNKQSGKVGSSHTTAPKKITGYKYKEVGNEVVGDIDAETGIINAEYAYGNSVVKYVYESTTGEEKAEGSVIVRYAKVQVDSDGELVEDGEGRFVIDREIAERDEFSGEIGEEFDFKDSNTVEAKEIYGYKIVGQDSYTGKYEEGIREITFFYEEDEKVTELAPVQGGLIVKFVDANGNEIRERVQQIGTIEHSNKAGETVEADTYSIDINDYIKELSKLGFGYKGVADDSASLSGVFEKGFKEIVFTFDKVKDDIEFADYSDVFVRYIDESGRDIHARDHFFEKIGSAYETNAKKINGYTLKEVKGEPSGKFGSETTHIEYVYVKDGADDNDDVAIYGGVTVKYVDENGRDISERKEIDGRVGDSYTTSEKEIDGYELQSVRGDAEGIIGEGIYTIEYVYAKVKGETPDGETPDGETPDGETPDGETPDGETPDGETPDGEKPDGEKPDGEKPDGEKPDGIVAKVLSHTFAVNVVDSGMTLDEVIKEYGTPTSTDFRGSTWIDEDGNMMLIYETNDASGAVEEIFFFDKDKHEVTTGDLSEFYGSVKYGDTSDELNKRIGTNGAQDMYISKRDATISVWVSDGMKEVMTVSFNDEGKADGKTLTTSEGRFAFSTMSKDGKDDKVVDEDRKGAGATNKGTQNGGNATDGKNANGKDANGKPLANTATNMYNMILAGLGLLATAGGSLFFMNRRRTNEDTE